MTPTEVEKLIKAARGGQQFPDSAFVFAERGGDAVNRLIKRIGAREGLGFPGTPAATPWRTPGTTRGRFQDWLGHRNITHTVRYTELSPTRFRDFWRD